MSFARDVYTATGGQTDFTITFAYLDEDDVLVYQNGTLLTKTTEYTFFTSTTIRLVTGATLSDTIIVTRATSQDARTTSFTAGTLTSTDMNADSNQLFYMAQEAIDIANTALGLDTDDNWTAASKRIKNVSTPTESNDAATKDYVDSAALGGLATPLAIGSGGTGSATAAAARTALGLEIDTDVQSHVMTTQGDMVRGGASGAPERFAIGSNGQILQSDGTDAGWVTKSLSDDVLTTQGDLLYQDGSGSQRLAAGTAGQALITGGSGANPAWGSVLNNEGSTATTSGTTVELSAAIPSGVTALHVLFNGVSIADGGHVGVQLGDSGGYETTGYTAGSETGGLGYTNTTMFPIYVGGAARGVYGIMTLRLLTGTTWIATHAISLDANCCLGGGVKALSGELTSVRLASTSGAFDAGAAAVIYEF